MFAENLSTDKTTGTQGVMRWKTAKFCARFGRQNFKCGSSGDLMSMN